MAGHAREKACGILTLIGGFLVHLSFGMVYSYGNLSPYLTSYIRERSKPESLRDQVSTTVYAVSMASLGLTMPLGGVIISKMGYRLTVMISGCLISAGVMFSFYSIKSSFYALIVTYGFLLGAGIGVGYMAPVVCAVKWFPKHKGRVNGIVMTGFGGGALIFDQIQTAFINPKNLSPNASLNSDERYFDDDEILDRVPSSFLVLGVIYLTLIMAGMLLLFNPPEKEEIKNKKQETEMLLKDQKGKQKERDNGSVFEQKKQDHSVHPIDVIKTWSFWNLWGTFLCTGLGLVFIPALYKAYGQTFISDDKFLATVGAISAIFNAGGRVLWGVIADVFSYRTAMLAMCSISVVFLLTLTITPIGGRIMYFIWICILFLLFGSTFTLSATAAAWTFGSEYVGINCGLVSSGLLVAGPIGVLLPMTLQDVVGWNGMFVIVAGFYAIGFLLTFKFNARRSDGTMV